MAAQAPRGPFRILAFVLAAGSLLLADGSSARERSPQQPRKARAETSAALDKRVAEQRYFDVVQQGLRLSTPMPPRFR